MRYFVQSFDGILSYRLKKQVVFLSLVYNWGYIYIWPKSLQNRPEHWWILSWGGLCIVYAALYWIGLLLWNGEVSVRIDVGLNKLVNFELRNGGENANRWTENENNYGPLNDESMNWISIKTIDYSNANYIISCVDYGNANKLMKP